MTRRAKVWLAVAVVFVLLNVCGAAVALAWGELPHAALHAGLALPGLYLVWRLTATHAARRTERRQEGAASTLASELADRLKHLEQSIDTVAVEVERIGEGQRFVARVLNEQAEAGAQAPHAGR